MRTRYNSIISFTTRFAVDSLYSIFFHFNWCERNSFRTPEFVPRLAIIFLYILQIEWCLYFRYQPCSRWNPTFEMWDLSKSISMFSQYATSGPRPALSHLNSNVRAHPVNIYLLSTYYEYLFCYYLFEYNDTVFHLSYSSKWHLTRCQATVNQESCLLVSIMCTRSPPVETYETSDASS